MRLKLFLTDLEENLSKIPDSDVKLTKERPDRSILEEILEDVRSIKRLVVNPEHFETIRTFSTLVGEGIVLNMDATEIGFRIRNTFRFYLSQSFQSMLNDIWSTLASKRFPSFTYGKLWILVDPEKGITYKKQENSIHYIPRFF